MLEKFEEMFRLQNKFNVETNGEDWTSGVTKDGRVINWRRCIRMEACEAIDSLNWKHWKDIDKPDDIENLKIEVVDIWHFIMSWVIEQNPKVSFSELAREVDDFLMTHSYGSDDTIIQLEKLVHIGSHFNFNLYDDIVILFFTIVDSIEDFDMDDVYKLYIGKNCLNQFRQDNGYKEGTYVKKWGGYEDNVCMQNFLSEHPDSTYDELYEYLHGRYCDELISPTNGVPKGVYNV